MLRQHEGVWPLRLTATMKGQITHSSFTQDWHHLSPSIFITSSHTLCYTPSLWLSIPFLLLYKAVTHQLQKSLSQSLIQLSTLSFTSLSLALPYPHFLSRALLRLNEKLWSIYHICSTVKVLAYPVVFNFWFSHGWQTHFCTHITKAHTHTPISAQSQLIRAWGPSLLTNLRVIKEPLDTGVSASCF